MNRLVILPLLLLLQTSLSQSFTGVNPKHGEYIEPGIPTFEWNDVGASSYTIEIATDVNFSNIVHSEATSNSQLTIAVSLNSGVYYWRVFDGSAYTPDYLLNVYVPSDEPDLQLWLNPSVGITQDGSGNISQWSDLNNGLNFLQGNSGEQPYYEPNGFRGHPQVEFAGDDFLSGGDVLDIGLNSRSVFLIGQSSGNNQAFISKSLAAGAPSRFSLLNLGGGTTFIYHDNANRSVSLPSINTENSLYQATVNRNQGEVSIMSNNGTAVSNTINNSYDLNSNFRFLIGAYNANPDNSEILHLNGSISEVIIIDNASSSSINKVLGFLKYKYMPKLDLGPDRIVAHSFCDSVELATQEEYKSYLWSTGETTQSIWIHEPGQYTIEAVDSLGFVWHDTVEVFYPRPDYPNLQTYCPSDSITWYTNLGPDYNYLWSDGSTADSLSVDSAGDYHVQITDTTGCVFESDTLTFNPDPFESIVTLGPDQNLCSGNTLTLQDGDSLAVDYLWNTSSTDSAIILNNSGTYYVDVINTNGCEASDTIDITIIGDAPVVTIGAPSTVCEGAEFTFEDFSNTTDGSTINGWNWDLGDGTVINVDDSSHVYNNDTTYEVSLTVSTTAGCSNTAYQQINVIPKPEMTFVSSNECQYSLIQFNGGQLSPTTITSWDWNFDDPGSGVDNTASGQNVSHVFDFANDFDVMLVGTDINGCKDTLEQVVSVLPSPQVDFEFDEVCEGNVVNFVNQTSIDPPGVVSSYNWSFGDGTNSGQTDPSKPYNSSGNYTVNLVATSTNGCSGQLSQNLKVHAIPVVDQLVESSCAGLNTTFNDNSFVPDGSVAEVLWSIENGAPLEGFTVVEVFEESGTVEVEQTVNSAFGCTNSETFNISIGDYLEAGFEYFPNALIAGTPIEFSSTSVGADFYEWTFQGIGTSVLPDTTVEFSNNLIGQDVEIELAVENISGCRDSVAVTLPVLERSTDLQVDELFLQEENGFYTVGVRLRNLGTTPINEVDLFLQSPGNPVMKEPWEGTLLGGETTVYVFNSSPTSAVPLADTAKNYVCIRGVITEPSVFEESDLSNNEVCNIIEPTESVVIAPQPNPINEQYEVKVILSSGEIGTLKVFDAQGRAVDVIFENTELSKGLNAFQVDASNYANGGYTLRYVGETGTHQVKIIKQ